MNSAAQKGRGLQRRRSTSRCLSCDSIALSGGGRGAGGCDCDEYAALSLSPQKRAAQERLSPPRHPPPYPNEEMRVPIASSASMRRVLGKTPVDSVTVRFVEFGTFEVGDVILYTCPAACTDMVHPVSALVPLSTQAVVTTAYATGNTTTVVDGGAGTGSLCARARRRQATS